LRSAWSAPAAAYDAIGLCWFDASRRKEAIQIGDVEPQQMAKLVEYDPTLRDKPTHEPLTDVQVLSRFRKRQGWFPFWARGPAGAPTRV
jgi:hypothetical protein